MSVFKRGAMALVVVALVGVSFPVLLGSDGGVGDGGGADRIVGDVPRSWVLQGEFAGNSLPGLSSSEYGLTWSTREGQFLSGEPFIPGIVISEPAFYVFLSPQVASSVVWETEGGRTYVDNGYPWRERVKLSELGAGTHTIRATVDGTKVIEVRFTLGSGGVQASATPTTVTTTTSMPSNELAASSTTASVATATGSAEPVSGLAWSTEFGDYEAGAPFIPGIVISEPAFYVFLSPQVASSVVWETEGGRTYVDNGYPWREQVKLSELGAGTHRIRATVDGDRMIEVSFTLGSGGVQASATPTTVASTPTTQPTTSTTSEPLSQSVPAGGVVVRPGESIQAAVDAHSGNTTFVIKAGVHRGQEVRPKAGNTFVGESGAVLDGGGSARWAFSSGAANVTIRGLVVQNYASPHKEGAINREGGAKNWLVEGNEVRDNSEVGIRGNGGWRILGNYVHGNGRYGITGSGTGLVVEGNEIANNAVIFGATGHSSGTKFVHTEGLVLRNNYVHDNQGNGLWADINNLNVLFEGNRIIGNTRHGIDFEISCGAVIRDNYLEGNGFLNKHPNWMNDAAIVVSTSPNVDIYGNTLVGNNNGIGLIHWAHNNRDAVTKCEPVLKNVKVHDNRIVQSGGAAAGLDASADREQVWTSWGNEFFNNTYTLDNGAAFRWERSWVTYQQWKNSGQN